MIRRYHYMIHVTEGSNRMKIQESGENYLESILMLSQEKGMVRSIDVVNALNFSKPSVSVAMRKLRESGYVEVDDNGFILLTKTGRAIAEEMYERHRFLSDYLVKLGVSPEIALEDACRIEHVISQESFECLKRHIRTEHTNGME